MKYGALVFSYTGSTKFAEEAEKDGFFSINVGDYMQTLAALNFYETLGIPEDQVIRVDRDTLSEYDGEPVSLLMNGCFYNRCFPLPKNVKPVFVGFQAAEGVIATQREELKRHEPIGCRDIATMELMKKYDIDAYVTGCMTMTFKPRGKTPKNGRVFLVYGSLAGLFPSAVLPLMPDELLEKVEMVYQRMIVTEFPLGEAMRRSVENYVRSLLDTYRRRATLVVTPLHHAATPSMAMGIPVVLCRKRHSDRFSYLDTFTNVYYSSAFSEIKWDVPALDMSGIQSKLLGVAGEVMTKVRQQA